MKENQVFKSSVDLGDRLYTAFDVTDSMHALQICISTDLKRVIKAAREYSKEYNVSLEDIRVYEMVKED